MRSALRSLVGVGIGLLVAGTTAAQEQSSPPAPETALKRACDAAGGLEAFKSLGIVAIATKSEEVTQSGKVSTTSRNDYFLAPGPIPGRFEFPDRDVVAADDGSGGWALLQHKPDTRLSTGYQVQRSLVTALFPVLLPFSLTWEGVAIRGINPGKVQGHAVWELDIELTRTFFDNPQISRNWTVSLDATTFAVARAESPFTDLGRGVTADGMRFTRLGPIKVGNVTLYKEQRVTGLDEAGQEKAHSRIDHLQYKILPSSEATKLFANPIPPDQRPKPPVPPPPSRPT